MLPGFERDVLLSSVAREAAPLIKGIGKYVNGATVYGVGTGIGGLDGLNQVVNEFYAAYAIYSKPEEEHVKPSLFRAANGLVNMAGYALYGAGSAGAVSRYAAGTGLLLIAASATVKQHFLKKTEKYYPSLPLYDRPVRRSSQASTDPTPPITLQSLPSPANTFPNVMGTQEISAPDDLPTRSGSSTEPLSSAGEAGMQAPPATVSTEGTTAIEAHPSPNNSGKNPGGTLSSSGRPHALHPVNSAALLESIDVMSLPQGSKSLSHVAPPPIAEIAAMRSGTSRIQARPRANSSPEFRVSGPVARGDFTPGLPRNRTGR